MVEADEDDDCSPLVSAVASIISAHNPGLKVDVGSVGSPDSPVWVLSTRCHFELMWGLLSSQAGVSSPPTSERTVVVIWDGGPGAEGSVDIARWVTPVDWAVAMSLYLTRSKERPALRVLIFDAAPAAHAVPAVQAFAMLRGALPWIQIYRPVTSLETLSAIAAQINDDSPSIFKVTRALLKPSQQDAVRFVADLRSGFGSVTSLADSDFSIDDAEMLRSMWSSLLLKAGSRHDIANVIGPIVLSRGLHPTKARLMPVQVGPAQRALVKYLELLNLVEMTSGDGAVLPKGALWNDVATAGTGGIVLIDDQAALGYRDFVNAALYSVDPVTGRATTGVRSMTDASGLLSAIRARALVTTWGAPRYLDYCDVLLLDLRLWSDDENGLRTAVQVLSDVCDTVSAVGVAPIDDASVRHAFRAADAFRKQPERGLAPDALALLPLFLSHYDPSLPIVLFSSTQQRAVFGLLKNRRNVITDFAKPAVGGYVAELSIRDYTSGFKRAMRHAKALHASRGVWQRIAAMATHQVSWPNLRILRRNAKWHEEVCRVTVTAELIETIAAECQRTLLSGRYADALQAPSNILEDHLGQFPHKPWKPHPDASMVQAKSFNSDDARAEYLYFGVLEYARNTRAHYRINADDDRVVAGIAVWLWHWFVSGLAGMPLTTRTGRRSVGVTGDLVRLPTTPSTRGAAVFEPLLANVAKALRNGVSVRDEKVVEEFWPLHARVVGGPR